MGYNQEGQGHTKAKRLTLYKDILLFQLAALTFIMDQFTKFLVREFLALHESFPEQGFFRITHTFNTGSAFGLFQDQNFPLILASVVGIAILSLIYRAQSRRSNLLKLSLGLVLGGAAGNLLDRVRMGYVTDFVDVGPWPIFNVADSSIVVGLLLLGWMFIVADAIKRQEADSQRDLECAGTSASECGVVSESSDNTSLSSEEGNDWSSMSSVPPAELGNEPSVSEDGGEFPRWPSVPPSGG